MAADRHQDREPNHDEVVGETAHEGKRTWRIVLFTGVLAALVMGGVVALGLPGGEDDVSRLAPTHHPDGGPYGNMAGDPYRDPGGDADGCPYDPDRPPRLVFDLPPAGVRFGQVKQGVAIEREVGFRNDGSGPLCIRRIESGCGCLKARLVDDKKRYEPGESGRILLTLDTRGREGEKKKTVTLYTNAADDPLRKFVVRASITLGLRIGPSYVNFGRATAGQPAKSSIRMRTPKEDADWEVIDVHGTRPLDGVDGPLVAYGWEVRDIPDARDLVREVVIEHPGITGEQGRSFKDEIVVRTTHPDRPEYRVPAHLLIVKPILAVPPRAVLGYVPSSLPPPRIRLIAGDASVVFKVTSVSFEAPEGAAASPAGPGFEGTFGQDESGEWWIDVRYDGKSRRSGPLKSTLLVHTDLDRMPVLRIDCFATVEEKR